MVRNDIKKILIGVLLGLFLALALATLLASVANLGFAPPTGALKVELGICAPTVPPISPVQVLRLVDSGKPKLVDYTYGPFFQFSLPAGRYEVKALGRTRLAIVRGGHFTLVRIGYFGPCSLF